MKHKLYEAVFALHRHPKHSMKEIFKHSNASKNKSFTAELRINEGKKPEISILDIKGYNQNYIKSKISREFRELENVYGDDFESNLLPVPDEGDIIRLSQDQNDENVTISVGTRYYSVNGSLIDCNGAEITEEFLASFKSSDEERCSTGNQDKTYYKYKLISRT